GYRFVAVVSVEADNFSQDPSAEPTRVQPAHRGLRFSRLSAVITLIALGITAVLIGRQEAHRTSLAAIGPTMTQVTANSLDDPISSGSISPDGKFLAFTDETMRMKIKILETGETQTIPEALLPKGVAVDWSIVGWFPESTRFVANAKPHGTMNVIPL